MRAGRDAAPAGEARNLALGRPGAPPGGHYGPPARSWLIGARMPRKARPGIEKCRTWSAGRRARPRRTRPCPPKAWTFWAPLGAPPLGLMSERKTRRRPGAVNNPATMKRVSMTRKTPMSTARAACALPSPKGRGCPSGGEAERGRVRGYGSSRGHDPSPGSRFAIASRSPPSPYGRGKRTSRTGSSELAAARAALR